MRLPDAIALPGLVQAGARAAAGLVAVGQKVQGAAGRPQGPGWATPGARIRGLLQGALVGAAVATALAAGAEIVQNAIAGRVWHNNAVAAALGGAVAALVGYRLNRWLARSLPAPVLRVGGTLAHWLFIGLKEAVRDACRGLVRWLNKVTMEALKGRESRRKAAAWWREVREKG